MRIIIIETFFLTRTINKPHVSCVRNIQNYKTIFLLQCGCIPILSTIMKQGSIFLENVQELTCRGEFSGHFFKKFKKQNANTK